MSEQSAPDVSLAIRAIWTETLGLDDIAADDDFFALGGHSLLVLQVLDAIQARTGVVIPLRQFFEAPTLRAVADCAVASQTDAVTS